MRKGFTLVELSIVFVIIGLLIGGILVGQSLVESAKINKAVSQIQQFDTAVAQFKSKFISLPGDSDKFQYGGNNNGLIEDLNLTMWGGVQPNNFRGENRNFWPALQIAGFKIEGISNQLDLVIETDSVAAIPSGPNQNVPLMPLGDNSGVIPFTVTITHQITEQRFSTSSLRAAEVMPPANYYFIANFDLMTDHNFQASGGAVRKWSENIPATQASSIDKKMDDGHPRMGKVLKRSHGNVTWCMANSSIDIVYNTTDPDALCAMMIEMER